MEDESYSPEQIAVALRQADAGTLVEEICRRLGVNEPTFYRLEEAVREPRDPGGARTPAAPRREPEAEAARPTAYDLS